MTSTLWGFHAAHNGARGGPNGAKNLVAIRGAKADGRRWSRTRFSAARCEYEWAGTARKARLLNLGRVGINNCSLA